MSSYEKTVWQDSPETEMTAERLNNMEDGIEQAHIKFDSIHALSKDYIVEQGTSGIWTYRKWNSGIVECWGEHSATLAIDTLLENCYRSETQYAVLPFTVYNAKYFVDCTDLNTWASDGPSLSDIVSIPYLLWRGSSYPSYTWYTKIFVIGRWKE